MIENEKFQEKFNYIINKALERAEELKGIKQPFIDETIKKEQEPDILHNTSKRPGFYYIYMFHLLEYG